MHIGDAYRQLVQRISELYGKQEANNLASWVMEEITGLSRVDRIIYKESPLTTQQQERLDAMSEQLARSMPVQYVLGYTWFCGMKMMVNSNVLIPRPETEELVEWIIRDNQKQLGNSTPLRILDIGTGSGCIPVALKKALPSAVISAIDISPGAIEIAKENAAIHGAEIQFFKLDFLDEQQWNGLGVFDVIVSNPPYVALSEQEAMNANVLEHEPHLALFVPDTDALVFYRAIASFAQEHLVAGGSIYTEINEEFAEPVSHLFQEVCTQVMVKKDIYEKDRMVKATK